MFDIGKILIVGWLTLLLVACGSKQQPERLTLIVDGIPQVIDGNKETQANMLRLLFVNNQSILDSYDYKGGCDTISLNFTEPFIELAVEQHTFLPAAKKMFLAETAYSLLQTGDTVRIRYLPEGGCHLESLQSSELTALYNLDNNLFTRLADSMEESINELTSSYILLKMGEGVPAQPDSIIQEYQAHLQGYHQCIDSLVQVGLLPPAYERYYYYRLGLLAARPLFIERKFSLAPPLVSQELTAAMNDSLCGYISYWYAVKEFREPMVRPSGNGELPRFEFIDSTGAKPKPAWVSDQRGVFDRLSDYEKDVPPHTLNLMRYICLDAIEHIPVPSYPEADKQLYLDKYRALTTDYLDFEYASLDKTAGLPFRFFAFLMEFSVCMWLFFAVYLFVRKRLKFGKRRVYLLLCLLLSLVIPLATLPAQLQMIEQTESWARVFNFVTEGLFCIYLLGCIYLLFELASWLWKVWRMKRDSWRIPAKDHTLCILMYEDSKPTIFGRSIFFCWDDWWHPTDRDSRDRMRDSQRYRIRNGHMFDSLLLAVMRTLCWANPLLRTYNMELQRVNDMAASNYIYANRCVSDYTATEEMQQLQSNLVYGLAGSDYQPNVGKVCRNFSSWLHGIKYQLAIFAVLLVIVALLVQLFTTIGALSRTSLFG